MINELLLPKAYVEVLEILKYIPINEYKKVPVEIINEMQEKKDKSYQYIIKDFDNFQEQEMLKETEIILAVFFRDYWATEEQRKMILKKEKYDLNILEQQKREKYNPNDIFKKDASESKISNIEKTEVVENIALIEYKESFFIKIKNFIINFLHKMK